jgi:hypothetical protein
VQIAISLQDQLDSGFALQIGVAGNETDGALGAYVEGQLDFLNRVTRERGGHAPCALNRASYFENV